MKTGFIFGPFGVAWHCLEAYSGEGLSNLSLKWPNDLLVGQQKLAGILVERGPWHQAGLNSLIIGIGLNVNGSASDFPTKSKIK